MNKPAPEIAKYNQLKVEVKKLKKFEGKAGSLYAVLLALVVVAVSVGFDLFWEMAVEKLSFDAWMSSQRWVMAGVKLLIWTAIFYFWLIKDFRRQLKRKTAALKEMEQSAPHLQPAESR